MMKKTCTVLLLSLSLISARGVLAWTVTTVDAGHEHDCDAPTNGTQAHADHGNTHCGNTTDHNQGTPTQEVCKDEKTSTNGTLLSGEYLSCGSGFGPSGSIGCSFTWITKCGTGTRSATLQAPLGIDGNLPACRFVTFTTINNGSGPGIECSWTTSTGPVQSATFCSCINGTFSCS